MRFIYSVRLRVVDLWSERQEVVLFVFMSGTFYCWQNVSLFVQGSYRKILLTMEIKQVFVKQKDSYCIY